MNYIIFMLAFTLTTCSNRVDDRSGVNPMVSANSLNAAQKENPVQMDSLILSNAELAKLYTRAIEAYIRASNQKEQSSFDSLFIGKQGDFPEIELPAFINSTKVHLLKQEDIDNNKSLYKKSSPFINLIGFIEADKAEFIFVTFYPGFNHQYDCYINYRFNALKKEFDLDKLRIEVLIRDDEGQAKYYAVYEDGKYIGDKPIAEKRK